MDLHYLCGATFSLYEFNAVHKENNKKGKAAPFTAEVMPTALPSVPPASRANIIPTGWVHLRCLETLVSDTARLLHKSQLLYLELKGNFNYI